MAAHAPARVTRARRAELLRGIYVILNDGTQTLELARAVLDAGVRIVQYRAKGGVCRQAIRSLRELTWERDALLIVNDDWRAVEEYDCDGVHLGPEDDGFAALGPIRAALRDRLIGLSCGTAREIGDANHGNADYLGVGPVFATASKLDAGTPLGIEGLHELARSTRLPVAAIGGITLSRLSEVRRSGVAMAAVISAVSCAPTPHEAAEQLVSSWTSRG